MSNLFLLNTRGIHAASENAQRSRIAMDGGGSMQKRRFCTAKTRVQKLTRRSIFELGTDAAGSTQKRDLRNAKLAAQNEHGRSFWARMSVVPYSRSKIDKDVN